MKTKLIKKETINLFARIIHQGIVCAETEHEKRVMGELETLFALAMNNPSEFLNGQLESILTDREKYIKKYPKTIKS